MRPFAIFRTTTVVGAGLLTAAWSMADTWPDQDWVTADTLERLTAEQKRNVPQRAVDSLSTQGVCEGVYIAPAFGDPQANNGTDSTQSVVEASADEYESTLDGDVVLSGDVLVIQGNRQLESDTITLNQTTRDAILKGAVKIRQPDMMLQGDEATINLNSKQFNVNNARYVVHKSRIRGGAKKIAKLRDGRLRLSSSTYTTCPPNSKGWRFDASQITLDDKTGWGTAKNTVIRVADTPIFYLPWITFPTDDRRQSGLLFPSIGRSSSNGNQIGIPYYLNLAPNYDATITPRFMSNRGAQLEGEFRYLTNYGKGEFGLSYLDNDDAFRDEKRTLFLWQHEGEINRYWSTYADYTRVSDPDYFKDLSTSLNARSKTHLNQEIFAIYRDDFTQTRLGVQRFQTLDTSLQGADLPYRKIPELHFTGNWPLNRALYANLDTIATRFEHPDSTNTDISLANRVVVSPSLEYRYRKTWLALTPRLQAYHSYYHMERDNQPSRKDTQTLYSTALDAEVFLERPITWKKQRYIQTLEPRVLAVYTPYEDQSFRPLFDSARYTNSYQQLFRHNRFSGYDRVGDAQQISLGLTTRLYNNDNGKEHIRASVGQTHYFSNRKVQLLPDQAPDTRRASPWIGELEVTTNRGWRMNASTQWDSINNNIDQTAWGIHYRSGDRKRLNLRYRYLDEGADDAEVAKIKQTDVSFAWPLNDRWRILGRWYYDQVFERSFETLVGFEYDSCCWRLRLINQRYLQGTEITNGESNAVKPRQGIYVQFQLKGLGGVGNDLDAMLEESIEGFTQAAAYNPD